MKKEKLLLLTIVSGIVLGLSFPPYGFGFLAYIALLPLIFIIEKLEPKNVFKWVFVSGIVFHLATVAWIRHITWVGLVAAVIGLAFFYSLPFFFTALIKKSIPNYWIIIFPFVVAGTEWIRSFDKIAFPWVILGNSQLYYLHFIQFADITSAFGVSWWVAMINSAVYLFIKRRNILRFAFIIILFLIPFAYSWNVLNKPVDKSCELKVLLVQGNVSPFEKWEDGNELNNILLYIDMTKGALAGKPDLVVWPETAVPVYLLETPYYRDIIKAFVDSIGVPLLTGLPSCNLDTREHWNSAGFFIPGKTTVQKYDKIHVVPFGEAFPMDEIFPSLKKIELGQANWDEGKDIVVFKSQNIPTFNAAICFESIFPDLIQKFIAKGSEFIVVITNDVWFGPKSSPLQHAMISVMRAVEFHRPVVRCANTGISMLIDPYGRITCRTNTFVPATLSGVINPQTRMTFYAKYGNIFCKLCLIFTVSCLIYCYFSRKYKR